MHEAIILFINYRDAKEAYQQLHKIHFIKRGRLKKQIQSMEEQIEAYNTTDKIHEYVNGIYVLLSTILYDHIHENKQFQNIRIVNNMLSIKLDNTNIWFMAKKQWFEISEPDLLYHIYRNVPLTNTKVAERWEVLCPQIFSLLRPIITIPITRRENNNARQSEPVYSTNFHEEEKT